MGDIAFHLFEAKSQLKEIGIESYGIDADLLLAKSIGKAREFVIGHPEYVLSVAEENLFLQLLERRLNREPMAHILGKREFWSRDFIVTKDTLDPRPDSETLIEAALSYFPDKDKSIRVLDLGTGTGCLLLTLLAEYPNSIGVGVDISDKAIAIAQENAKNLDLDSRVEWHYSPWEDLTENIGKFDLIITNPPYVPTDDIPSLEPEVYQYEPHTALFAGKDGMDCYNELIPLLPKWMNKDCIVIIEHGINQEQDIAEIITANSLKIKEYCKDLSGISRCLVVGS